MEKIIRLDKSNIDSEHICCAISDKKCKEGYELKKDWLRREFANGYVFLRLDVRAKVFLEYCPAENGWVPVDAPNYLLLNCFWVAGQYKGKGYGKELLRLALEDAASLGKSGLVTVAGTKKFPFMSDARWLIRQGFEVCEQLPSGFSLLVRKIDPKAENPKFKETVRPDVRIGEKGIVVYYSNRCPYTEFHVKNSLAETAAKRNLPVKAVKLETMEQAQSAPTPATIFSLFYDGKFITTDLSVCMDSRFDKIMGKSF
ncbi:MAG: N-acetyltransferase [Bacteroidales bacterium]|jgi:GNAT superfamily N-acetyltransferase|nr:N-acetyltransferase [Bacteroidales bacterium]